AIYRIRDKEHNEALRALLAVIEAEVRSLEEDIDGLYANQFIETCAEWVVPYIGDLIGVSGLQAGGPRAFSLRPYVAHTLAYRRRKGTTAVVEQVARDITGWTARAVEYFNLLGGTQHVNHVRPDRARTCNLRHAPAISQCGTPFDRLSHTVDLRLAESGRGRHNIPTLGIHLWRLNSYYLERVPAKVVPGRIPERYTFSPLGDDLPLFNRPKTEAELTHLAEEVNVPGRLRREPLHRELAQRRLAIREKKAVPTIYFDEHPPFQVYVGRSTKPVPAEKIVIGDLSEWDRENGFVPAGRELLSDDPAGTSESEAQAAVIVDPELGRLLIPPIGESVEQPVHVSYAYGFSGDIGGGPYDRSGILAGPGETVFTATVSNSSDQNNGIYPSIMKAFEDWQLQRAEKPTVVITINDNDCYEVKNPLADATEDGIFDLNDGEEVVIQAGNKQRPVLRFVDNDGNATSMAIKAADSGEGKARLTLNGLLIEGSISLADQCLEQLNLIHCTLVRAKTSNSDRSRNILSPSSIIAEEDNVDLRIVIEASIVGPLRLPENMAGLAVYESIIDAGQNGLPAIGPKSGQSGDFGPCSTVTQSTILGAVSVRELALASDTIFDGKVTVKKSQAGFARFCYLPHGSRTPKRFRCQPELAILPPRDVDISGELSESTKKKIIQRIKSRFTSRKYGEPGYGQLTAGCAPEIRTGGENGSEMGAFNFLLPARREANLRIGLDDYLPFGLEAGIFYVT
ncbi:MAG: hypothetical protein V3W14_07810, partial [Candidatus Neomarinimicrobiota bacterium]